MKFQNSYLSWWSNFWLKREKQEEREWLTFHFYKFQLPHSFQLTHFIIELIVKCVLLLLLSQATSNRLQRQIHNLEIIQRTKQFKDNNALRFAENFRFARQAFVLLYGKWQNSNFLGNNRRQRYMPFKFRVKFRILRWHIWGNKHWCLMDTSQRGSLVFLRVSLARTAHQL